MRFDPFMLAAPFLFPLAALGSSGLCINNEETIFNCMTSKKKWISLCGNPPAALQYRFGLPASVEFQYPPRPEDGTKIFHYAHYWRYQTDKIEVGFLNRSIEYSVFDYLEGNVRQAGVRVTLNDKEMTYRCVGKIHSRLANLKPFIACDPDNALNMLGCPSESGQQAK